MTMRWLDLVFAHWPAPRDHLQRLLPEGLEIDTFDGSAWLGIVPFRMAGVRGRCLPPLPGASTFPELNVRTYVRCGPRTGVWFFSLDAASRLAVRVARATFRLPYFDARMTCARQQDRVLYRSERTHRNTPAGSFAGSWSTPRAFAPAARDTFEHWLVERYALFTTGRDGAPRIGDINHAPWQVARCELQLERCDLTRLLGLELEGPPASVLAAAPIDVVGWVPTSIPRD